MKKTYRLITTDPLELLSSSLNGKPSILKREDGVDLPALPEGYAYVQDLAAPEEDPEEGFRWVRELTIEQYGWRQVENTIRPRWYTQPAWRLRTIAKVTPYGDSGDTLMDAINAAIPGITDPLERAAAEEVFFGGNTLERDSILLTTMAVNLGLTSAQLDDLFISANEIEV